MIDRHLNLEGDQARVATFIFPTDPAWRSKAPDAFLQSIRTGTPVDPSTLSGDTAAPTAELGLSNGAPAPGGDAMAADTTVTGLNVMGTRMKAMFRTDALRAVGLGITLVFVMLLIDFRNLKLTAYGLAQLLVGIVWMLGLMRWAGVQMNFVNAFATTMILGVGIDYGIHLIHRILEQGSVATEGAVETGKAVVMAALTNIAGFGTIALSNFPGIRSVGLVCLFGTAGCLLTSLTLMPALMKLTYRPRSTE